MTDFTERRRMARFDLELEAHLSLDETPAESATLLTRNLSIGGALLKVEDPLPVGTPVTMVLRFPLDELRHIEGENIFVRISGKVVRTETGSMAVRFEGNFFKISSPYD